MKSFIWIALVAAVGIFVLLSFLDKKKDIQLLKERDFKGNFGELIFHFSQGLKHLLFLLILAISFVFEMLKTTFNWMKEKSKEKSREKQNDKN